MTMVTTAGAYVRFGERWLFALGPRLATPQLAVYRLGGHCEAGDTASYPLPCWRGGSGAADARKRARSAKTTLINICRIQHLGQ